MLVSIAHHFFELRIMGLRVYKRVARLMLLMQLFIWITFLQNVSIQCDSIMFFQGFSITININLSMQRADVKESCAVHSNVPVQSRLIQ